VAVNIGAQKDRAEAQLLDASLSFSDRAVNIEGGDHAGTDHFAGTGLAEIVEPVVIAAGKRGSEFRL
jgi:hypothetical protein